MRRKRQRRPPSAPPALTYVHRAMPPRSPPPPLPGTHPSPPSPHPPPSSSTQGRAATALRPYAFKTGVVSAASGSCFVQAGATKVLVSVFGPRQHARAEYTETGVLHCEWRSASFARAGARRDVPPSSGDRHAAWAMVQALSPSVRLEAYPKSSVDLFVLVLQDEGSALAAALCAASVALADAAIEMFDLTPACSLVMSPDGNVRLDPTAAEEADERAPSLTIATMPATGYVTQNWMHGPMGATAVVDGMALLSEACDKLHETMRASLLKTAKRAHKKQ